MTRLPHYLHIYEKPARVAGGVADTQHRRLLALNYRHKISAMGGFDTASCDIGVDRAEAEFVFGNLVGNRVAVYADNPVVPIWEGFINRVTIQAGSVEISRSLDAMANRVVAQFTDGTLDLEQTAEATDTTSIAIYGSKMKTLDMGEMYTTATAAAEALRDARSTQLAYPVISTVGGGSGGYRVSIEMLGFYHTLTWDTFAVVDTTTVTNAPAEILLNGTGDDYSYNYNLFFDEDDASRISSTTFSLNNSRQLGESSWDLLLRIAEMGDGGTRRVVGIAETSPNSGSRAAYYEDANTDIEYTTYAYSDGRIYSNAGQEVNPWDVRPNRSIRINNLLIGKPDATGDGKTAYLTSIDYDAESGQVSWVTDDNVTLEGVMGLTIESRATNERFGAERRDVLVNALTAAQGGTGADNGTGADGQILRRSGANGNFVATGIIIVDSSGNVTIMDPAGGGTSTLTMDTPTTTNQQIRLFRAGGGATDYFLIGKFNNVAVEDTYDTISWRYRSAEVMGLSSTNIHISVDLEIDGDLNHDGSNVGFYNTAPIAKPTVTGSRGGNAALASLLTALAGLGLITNSSSA